MLRPLSTVFFFLLLLLFLNTYMDGIISFKMIRSWPLRFTAARLNDPNKAAISWTASSYNPLVIIAKYPNDHLKIHDTSS